MLYVGVDAHSETSWITVMNQKGKILKKKEIASSRDAVQENLGYFRQPVKAVVEASYSWAPMYDWLEEVADDVILAHPAKVRAIAEARIKTDKVDSHVFTDVALTVSGFACPAIPLLETALTPTFTGGELTLD